MLTNTAQHLQWGVRAGLLGLLCSGLLACTPALKVTLLPEANGQASAVIVQGRAETLVLDHAYAQAAVSDRGQVRVPRQVSPEVVEKELLPLRQLQAQAGFTHRLQFLIGQTTMTPESQALFQQVLEQAQGLDGGEIILIGHTDAIGSSALNDKLSLARAQALRPFFITAGFAEHRVRAAGRGSRDPLPGTEDQASSPENRRVEIIVR